MKLNPLSSASFGLSKSQPLKSAQSPINFKGGDYDEFDSMTYDDMQRMNMYYLNMFRPTPIYSEEGSREHAVKIAGDFLTPMLEGKKINSLCDLGCGEGRPTKVLADALNVPSENVVGVDNLGSHHVSGIDFVSQDMNSYLTTTDKKFDIITMCRPDYFYHDPDGTPELLTNIGNALSDGGHFFMYGSNTAASNVIDYCYKNDIDFERKGYHFENMRSEPGVYENIQAILIKKEDLVNKI